jgi:hypothetical protein
MYSSTHTPYSTTYTAPHSLQVVLRQRVPARLKSACTCPLVQVGTPPRSHHSPSPTWKANSHLAPWSLSKFDSSHQPASTSYAPHRTALHRLPVLSACCFAASLPYSQPFSARPADLRVNSYSSYSPYSCSFCSGPPLPTPDLWQIFLPPLATG